MKIFLFDLEPWEKELLSLELKDFNPTLFEDSVQEHDNSEFGDVEVLGCFVYSTVNAELLKELPKLRLIVTYSTGFDHIDLKYCRDKGITVCNVPTYGENTVAEHTFALILNLTRKVHLAHHQMMHGVFGLEGLRGIDLKNRTLGIIGLGHIGKHVARIAQGFEMNILVHDPIIEHQADRPKQFSFVDFNSLLASSDIITFHCPLTDETRHLLNQKNVLKCKKGVYVVNTSRGEVIETDALIQGLEAGIVSGIGLDVVEEEQCFLRGEEKEILSKKFDQECMRTVLENHLLLKDPRVIITPHNAFNSQEALERIFQTTVANIRAFESGHPINTC